MPPRHSYWTIILEGKPTAFRAHTEDELLPTLKQLQTRHPDAVMRWFARGKLWHSQEEERLARAARDAQREKRGRDWRPGGTHRDPRERFDIPRDERRRRFRDRLFRDRQEGGKMGNAPGSDQDSARKPPHGDARPPARENRRPWRPHPDRPRRDEGERSARGESKRPPWKPKPTSTPGERGKGERPRQSDKPGANGERRNRDWKPSGPPRASGWKPTGPPRGSGGWKPKGPPRAGGGWKSKGPKGRGGGNRGGGGGGNRGSGGGGRGGPR
jgi:23S rRNA pseudouridine2605 synthase